MTKRKNFPPKVFEEAKEMWGHKCAHCRTSRIYDPHHIRARSDHGKGVATNILPVCRPCHDAIEESVHLQMMWKEWAKEKYGTLYWADEWDKEEMKAQKIAKYKGV